MTNEYCKTHTNIRMKKTMKLYCPECEGYFSAHGFNNIHTCPFSFNSKNEDPTRDLGRAYPLIKGSSTHFVIKIFNNSLKELNPKKIETILSKIYTSQKSFVNYLILITSEKIVESCVKELLSFFEFKRELFESLTFDKKPENAIPIAAENWLSIPFSREQYNKVLNKEKNAVKNWSKIGIHNIVDEGILDADDKVICIDYKTYPRKTTKELKEISSTEKKYQLITALLTFEYNYNVPVKFVANVDLGVSGFPNITYHKPTDRGITYYKKALSEAYKNLFEKNFPTKYKEYFCTKFCEFKLICPDKKMKEWRKAYYVNLL